MKKICCVMLFLLSKFSYSWKIPVTIPLKIGYAHSTNERKYRGLELSTTIGVHSINETSFLGLEPFIYFMKECKNTDPGMLLTYNKTIPFSEKYGAIFSVGVGGMYFGFSNGRQNIGFNFIEKIEAGLYRKLNYGVTVNLKTAAWHISDAGIRGHGNGGVDGYKIILGFEKAF